MFSEYLLFYSVVNRLTLASFMDFATDGFCNCKVSVLLLAQFFLGGYRHSGRVLRTPILPLGKNPS